MTNQQRQQERGSIIRIPDDDDILVDTNDEAELVSFVVRTLLCTRVCLSVVIGIVDYIGRTESANYESHGHQNHRRL
jgi:hypothetical protein